MGKRDTILGASDLTRETVDVPEWGLSVDVITMNGHQRAAWSDVAFDADGHVIEPSRPRLLAHTLYDAGERIFSDEDFDAIDAKSPVPQMRLFAIAKRLNGLGEEEAQATEKK